MCINFYGKMYGGINPDCIFVWKVPAVHGLQHAAKVEIAIDSYRELAPKLMGQKAVRNFNTIMDSVADIPAGARDALRNFVFCGNPNPDDTVAEKYVQFVLDLVAGQASSYKLHMSYVSFCLSYQYIVRAYSFTLRSQSMSQCLLMGE